MNIVYLIGNGFDINLGLKTRFTDFYQYYLQQDSSSLSVQLFKSRLSNSLEKWADLEVVLGDYAKYFTNETVDDFINLVFDIQDNLAAFIKQQIPNDIKMSDNTEQKLTKDLFSPNAHLSPRDNSLFLGYKKNYNTNCDNIADIINFNYSPTFELLFSYQNKSKAVGSHLYYNKTYKDILNSVYHVHGTTEENMILGVNDITQINNEELRNNKKIRTLLIKPETNIYTGTLRDVNSKNRISEANLICIFGMSLGITDKIWWQAIVNRLVTSDACLMIFGAKKGTKKLRSYMSELDKDEIKNKLLSFSDIKDDYKNYVLNKTLISFNSEMFHIPNLNESKYTMLRNDRKNIDDISS